VADARAEALMRRAIEAARRGIAVGQSPFGCAIEQGNLSIAVEHNRVLLTTDITAHAEITALRAACTTTGAIHLDGALVASTNEPCPMCMAALHWARVERVVYGATIAAAAAAGFNELRMPAGELLRIGRSNVILEGGVLVAECRELFAEWRRHPGWRPY
jgi:tRNA(Arg) A34 adenosine deaminase TadA